MKNFGLRHSIVAMAACAAFVGGSSAMAGPAEFQAAMEAKCMSRTAQSSEMRRLLASAGKSASKYCACEASVMTNALVEDINTDMRALSAIPFVIIQSTSRFALLRCCRLIRDPSENDVRQALHFHRCAPLAVRPDFRYRSGCCDRGLSRFSQASPGQQSRGPSSWNRRRSRRYSSTTAPLFLMIEDCPHAPHVKVFSSSEPMTFPCG